MTMHDGNVDKDLDDLELASSADACAEGDPAAAVLLFRSLADPARLIILQHLTLGEHRVVDLTNHLGLAQSTTSTHLSCLRDCGLVSVRTVGRASMYSLAVGEELMGLLSAAERLLAATGDAVTLCPTMELPQAAGPADSAGVRDRNQARSDG
ncbi:MAG: metalloregulator ArsR/SmtB family transcription factor [Arachnia sp.]